MTAIPSDLYLVILFVASIGSDRE